MAELVYKIINGKIHLNRLKDGIVVETCYFVDREEMLLYIENNYEMAKLYIS